MLITPYEEACKIIDKKLEKSGWVIKNLEVAYIVTDTAATAKIMRTEKKTINEQILIYGGAIRTRISSIFF